MNYNMEDKKKALVTFSSESGRIITLELEQDSDDLRVKMDLGDRSEPQHEGLYADLAAAFIKLLRDE